MNLDTAAIRARMGRLLGRIADRMQRAALAMTPRGDRMITVSLAVPQPWGFLDAARIDPGGLVRLVGWSQHPTASIPTPRVTLAGRPLVHLGTHRFPRADVAAGADQIVPQSGVVIEYLRDAAPTGAEEPVGPLAIDERSWEVPGALTFHAMHYDGLLTTDTVLGREHIYGFGPPSPIVAPDVLDLVAGLGGRVLDFGCGSGALVAALRGRGVEAFGIELDRGPIRETLKPEAAPYVTLYDGRMPSPFEDGSFDAVVCSEVLEHIPDFAAAVAEMARLTRDRLVITVPDAGVIPLGSRHQLVPWHLLESTHVNFFNQRSLHGLLAPHFGRIDSGRISPCTMNDTPFHVSLVAVCRK